MKRTLVTLGTLAIGLACGASCVAEDRPSSAGVERVERVQAAVDTLPTLGVWRRIDIGIPPFECDACMAFDATRAKVVALRQNAALATNETWLWDGARWAQATPASSPPVSDGQIVVFDEKAKRIAFVARDEMWGWDGTTWTKIVTGPTPISGPAAFDRTRNVLVVATASAGKPIEAWAWDGSAWTLKPSVDAPTPRTGHAVAFDAARGRLVLFGGAGPQALGDTWEWDGAKWIAMKPAASPPARSRHALVYDPQAQRVVLLGGTTDGTTAASDAWSWNGTTWTRLASDAPAARMAIGAAFDTARNRMVIAGGSANKRSASDTWELVAGTWTPLATNTPDARITPAMAYDATAKKTVLFGGQNRSDTWVWDGATWKEMQPAHVPQQREAASMAYDAARAKIVLFGGRSSISAGHIDTWGWDGSDWQQYTTTTHPTDRWSAGMAYDEARQRIVLFGGMDSSRIGITPVVNDTWEWDGATWTQRSLARSPTARMQHAMAYDAKRARTLLFGGSPFTDTTWTWTGVEWVEIAPPVAPEPRNDARLGLDPRRGRIVLFGGDASIGNNTRTFDDTWEWDGQAWTPMRTASAPAFTARSAAAFDADRGRFVYAGEGETWEYSAFGGSCSSDAECDTGHCLDGICCAVASCGTCQACALGDTTATCANVARGKLDHDSCAGACDGAGACKAKGGDPCSTNDVCATGFCAKGVCCASESCGGYACGSDGACKTSCAIDADCVPGLRCDESTHACVAGASCVDGDAIHASGEREACAPFTCSAGTCKPSCATNDDCADPGAVCDERGACVAAPVLVLPRCSLASAPRGGDDGAFFGVAAFVLAAGIAGGRARRRLR